MSSMNLFSNYTGLDSSSNPQTGFIFRMQPGMIMPAGPPSTGRAGTTKYRLCSNSALRRLAGPGLRAVDPEHRMRA